MRAKSIPTVDEVVAACERMEDFGWIIKERMTLDLDAQCCCPGTAWLLRNADEAKIKSVLGYRFDWAGADDVSNQFETTINRFFGEDFIYGVDQTLPTKDSYTLSPPNSAAHDLGIAVGMALLLIPQDGSDYEWETRPEVEWANCLRELGFEGEH